MLSHLGVNSQAGSPSHTLTKMYSRRVKHLKMRIESMCIVDGRIFLKLHYVKKEINKFNVVKLKKFFMVKNCTNKNHQQNKLKTKLNPANSGHTQNVTVSTYERAPQINKQRPTTPEKQGKVHRQDNSDKEI